MKKLISLILATVMLVSCFAVTGTAAEEERLICGGDLNRDGKNNLSDVSLLLKYIAKWNLGDDFPAEDADVDATGRVNIGDVSEYLRWIAYNGPKRVVVAEEEKDWMKLRKLLMSLGLPVPSFDEWLISIGIDPEKYYEYLDALGDKYFGDSYKDWLDKRS